MKLQHITIHTGNYEEEIKFYETYAGLKILMEMKPQGQRITFLADAKGDTEIEIIDDPNAQPIDCKGLAIGFSAENLDELREKFIEEGFAPTPFISPAPVVRFFFVKDPAGLSVQFIWESNV